MFKMKKTFYHFFLFLIPFIGYANTNKSISFYPISREEPGLTGNLQFRLFYSIQEDITLAGQPQFVLPQTDWTISTANNSRFSNFTSLTGDTFSVIVNFNYNPLNLPFYAQSITVKQMADGRELLSEIKIYFTPYNTVEIWNCYDFNHLRRNWMAPTNMSVQRQYIAQSNIPISDIPTNYTVSQSWEENTQEVFVPGLAYSVPMLAVDPANAPANLSGPSNQALGDGCILGKRFRATVEGNLLGNFINEATGILQDRALKGLAVELFEGNNNQVFTIGASLLGTAEADANGHFSIFFDVCRLVEGENLEIFLKIPALNLTYQITGKSADTFWGNFFTATEVSSIAYVTHSSDGSFIDQINFGNIHISNEAHKAVYLSVLAYDFSNQYSGMILPP
jgi:hypothetical protein